MEHETLTKNEYIALELTRMWCGQEGAPSSAKMVFEKFEYFLDQLNKEV